MKKTVQRLKNERGLTLVELLAVIVILAIIAVIAFVFIGGVIDNSKKDAHIANAQQVISAAKLHEATGGDFSDAESVTVENLIDMDYLDTVIEPWTKDDPYAKDATITKSGDKFQLTNFNASGCNFGTAPVSEKDINGADRETLCKK